MMAFLDFLKKIEPVVQILTLVALILYVWKTWTMASATEKSAKASELALREMKLTREQQAQPHVICYFECDPSSRHLYDLVITNVGPTMAYDVRVAFIPAIQSYSPHRQRPALEEKRIMAMPPQYAWRTLWGSFIEDKEETYPKGFQAAVSFTWGAARIPVKYDVSFDIQSLKGASWIREEPVEDTLVKISEALADIERQLREANARAVEGQEEIDEPEIPS